MSYNRPHEALALRIVDAITSHDAKEGDYYEAVEKVIAILAPSFGYVEQVDAKPRLSPEDEELRRVRYLEDQEER